LLVKKNKNIATLSFSKGGRSVPWWNQIQALSWKSGQFNKNVDFYFIRHDRYIERDRASKVYNTNFSGLRRPHI
jgi:hypothetical protein